MKRFRRPLLAALIGLAAVLVISACTAGTDSATSITSTSATFNGHGACGSSDSGTWTAWFEYRVNGTGAWTSTQSTPGGSTTGTCSGGTTTISKSLNVTGLTPSTTYQYRVGASMGGATGWSDSKGVTNNDAGGNNNEPYTQFTTLAAPPPPPSGVNWANGWGTYSNPSSLPGSNWRPYSDSSWSNLKLPASPTILSQSSTWVNDMFNNARNGASPAPLHAIPSGSGNDYQYPEFFSKSTDPVWTIACSRNCNLNGVNTNGMQVHIPTGALPATGSDHQMLVYDQAQNKVFDLGVTSPVPTTSSGGTINVSLASAASISGDALNDSCSDAACVGGGSGLIRPAELSNGTIPHVIRIVNRCGGDPPIFPAWTGNPTGQGCTVPNGAYFWLDSTSAPVSVPDWVQTIINEMHDYGLMVSDQGSNWAWDWQTGMDAQSFLGGTNTWTTWANAEVAKYGSTSAAWLSSNGSTSGMDLLINQNSTLNAWEHVHLHAVSAPCSSGTPGC